MDGRVFPDRVAGGRVLGDAVAEHLRRQAGGAAAGTPLVLGLPRGGVPVATQVARAVGGELDVVVARKVGLPWQPELGVGAVTEEGPPVWNSGLLRRVGLAEDALTEDVTREREETRRRVRAYRGDRPPPRIEGRSVVVVDDGLATGITARAALRAVRAQQPGLLVFAAPVCAAEAAEGLSGEADSVVCVWLPEDFGAVGTWYADFEQLTDEQVERILDEAWHVRAR